MLKMSLVRPVTAPVRAHHNDAGLDFFIPNDWNDGKIMTLGFGDSVSCNHHRLGALCHQRQEQTQETPPHSERR